jgi:RNA polymerase sigma factor (TIGR02999 family)
LIVLSATSMADPADPTSKLLPSDVSTSELLAQLLPEGANIAALSAALPAVYEELRELATSYLRRERSDHTLQPTALVHESYLRLRSQHTVDWSDRLQFLSIASRMMRRILSDHADTRRAGKRGSGIPNLQLEAALDFYDNKAISIVAVDDALRRLQEMDARQAQLVELRFFGGLTIQETAEVMALSVATVKREWVTARKWLQREIAQHQ